MLFHPELSVCKFFFLLFIQSLLSVNFFFLLFIQSFLSVNFLFLPFCPIFCLFTFSSCSFVQSLLFQCLFTFSSCLFVLSSVCLLFHHALSSRAFSFSVCLLFLPAFLSCLMSVNFSIMLFCPEPSVTARHGPGWRGETCGLCCTHLVRPVSLSAESRQVLPGSCGLHSKTRSAQLSLWCLSAYVPVSFSLYSLPVCLCPSVSVQLSLWCLSAYVPVSLSVQLSWCLSACLPSSVCAAVPVMSP